jgi:hypothetical protein
VLRYDPACLAKIYLHTDRRSEVLKGQIMYTLVRNIRSWESVFVEAPSLAFSFVIAEVFYKFHSFTLECACFLCTWLVASSLCSLLLQRSLTPVR